MIKRILYSAERLYGKVRGHEKILVTEVIGNRTYVRRVSKEKLQVLIMDPLIKSVEFLK